MSQPARIELEIKRLALRHTWTTTTSSSDFRDTIHLRYLRDGITGYGEGAPIPRYGESAQSAFVALQALVPMLATADPWSFHPLLAHARTLLGPHQPAALAAVDLALFDWLGKKLNLPLHRYFGLDPASAPLTSFSLGIDTPERTRQKVLEADPYPILKIKVGLDSDEETITTVRSLTSKPIRVDANEGWTDPEEAIRKIRWLEALGVELIEQPMPAHMLAETRYVRSRVHLPIFADEACTRAASFPQLRNSYDGVNVKLDKTGGILEAYHWISLARALDLKVMLGCMVSSSCSSTAAAQLASLADFCDLDGNLLLANDPFHGVQVEQGRLLLPQGPGLGVKPLDFGAACLSSSNQP